MDSIIRKKTYRQPDERSPYGSESARNRERREDIRRALEDAFHMAGVKHYLDYYGLEK